MRELVREIGVSKEAALYFLIQRGLGVSVLDRTTNLEHICSDVEDLERIENWVGQSENKERLVSLEEFARTLERGGDLTQGL